jgi:hypothetical protein
VQSSTLKWIVTIALAVIAQQVTAKNSADHSKVNDLERVIIYAIQVEVQASQLKSSGNLCVGFGNGLLAKEETVVGELVQNGLKVHTNDKCTGAHPLRIAVVSPVIETSPGEYKIVLELSDMSMKSNEHFATLLRRGIYVVRVDSSSKPRMFSYQETCCAKTN